jgi:excisionase family DNA binding protein
MISSTVAIGGAFFDLDRFCSQRLIERGSRKMQTGASHGSTENPARLSTMGKLMMLPKFLTVEEVAELLRVSPRSIYDWVSQGVIPFHKAGRRTIFLVDEILEWTNRNDDPQPQSSRPA